MSVQHFTRQHVRRLISQGRFPATVKLRIATNRWIESQIDDWFAKRKAERDEASRTELADIGKANNRMKQNNVPIVYGIGKHPPSGSFFLYFLDPDGMTVEYSFGMEEFPEVNPRAAGYARDAGVDRLFGGGDPRSGKTGVFERL